MLADDLREYSELAPVDLNVRDVERDDLDERVDAVMVLRDEAVELPVCGREPVCGLEDVAVPRRSRVTLLPILWRLNLLSGIASCVAKGVGRARSFSKNSSLVVWCFPSGLS